MKIELKKFTSENIELTYEWIKIPELRHMFMMRGEINYENHKKYFARVLNDSSQIVYAIFANDIHIGNCGLKNIDSVGKQAELWIYIGNETFKGIGAGKKAVLCLLEEGRKMNFSKIFLHVAQFNQIAQRMYHTIGFVETDFEDSADDWKEKKGSVIRMEFIL